MEKSLTGPQKRALAIATGVALIFGAYFLSGYFILIVVAAVAAYLFEPMYQWFLRRYGTGLSVTLTVLAALLMLVIPITLLVTLAVVQISAMVRRVQGWLAGTDLSTLGDRTLTYANDLIDRIPLLNGVDLTPELLQERLATLAQHVGEYLLGVLQGPAGGLLGAVTAAVLFLYVFISLLSNSEGVQLLVRRLNPLGEEVTDLYLGKMGAMVRGTVRGQFVIALAQGLSGALSIYIAGLHEGFFIFAILLVALSMIPLGGGIISIPLGIGMIFFGNVWGGAFVIAFHLLVVTNIDNVLRPILVPKEARMDSALMLLAVFAGITMFGFWGLIIGPVIMIVIVTTISVYLNVYQGVPLDAVEPGGDEPKKPGRLRTALTRALERRRAVQPVEKAASAAAE
ncbi:AI-2E family transporter [Mycolicibacterium arenosum]|uniref:AI-2E family transporter n=1 Tax=Mycolicibacterium arenosum TaxID=2952157 RepID=A0ABT1LYN1_9MYCO|nr:AI-2E family transporter [Mycolicibacterium sp. CAU 1645]MCP9270717.1 AI-2E family transporter [Mycolicibacterium sp. CAU 1645]